MKKIILLVLVLCFVLFLGVSFNSCGASGKNAAGLTDATSSVVSTPVPTVDPEVLHQEIEQVNEEAKNEEPLVDESGETIPTVTISEQFEIELEENQGSGGF